MAQKQLKYNPNISEDLKPEFISFCSSLAELTANFQGAEMYEKLGKLRGTIGASDGVLSDSELALAFAQSLLLDLLLQDWKIELNGEDGVMLHYDGLDKGSPLEEKERIRRRHLIRRNEH